MKRIDFEKLGFAPSQVYRWYMRNSTNSRLHLLQCEYSVFLLLLSRIHASTASLGYVSEFMERMHPRTFTTLFKTPVRPDTSSRRWYPPSVCGCPYVLYDVSDDQLHVLSRSQCRRRQRAHRWREYDAVDWHDQRWCARCNLRLHPNVRCPRHRHRYPRPDGVSRHDRAHRVSH